MMFEGENSEGRNTFRSNRPRNAEFIKDWGEEDLAVPSLETKENFSERETWIFIGKSDDKFSVRSPIM